MMLYTVHCNQCQKTLCVASHIVDALFCDDECAREYYKGRRKVRDDPRA